jgi:hypothetical protein
VLRSSARRGAASINVGGIRRGDQPYFAIQPYGALRPTRPTTYLSGTAESRDQRPLIGVYYFRQGSDNKFCLAS